MKQGTQEKENKMEDREETKGMRTHGKGRGDEGKLNEIIDFVNTSKEESTTGIRTIKAEMRELKTAEIRTINAETKELKTTEAEAARELKTMKEDITAIKQGLRQGQRGMQKVKKEIKEVQLKGSDQTREIREQGRAPGGRNDHLSERNTGRKYARGSERAATVAAACEVGTAEAHNVIVAGMEKAMQAWDATIAAMS